MKPPTVFISYSHQDEEWKDRLVKHLRVLEQEGILRVWEDRRIPAGAEWHPEIENAINEAAVAVLMVSENFLTSEFILGKEVPRLLERREKEGLCVIPLIVKPCAWRQVKWLKDLQARPKDAKALSSGSESQIDADLSSLVDEIADIVQREEPAVVAPSVPEAHKRFSVPKSLKRPAILLMLGIFFVAVGWWSHFREWIISGGENVPPVLEPTPSPTSGAKTGETGKIEIPGTGVTIEMVYVQGGSFEMGSPPSEEGRENKEGPVHEVTIPPFWIGKYEVTQEQWKAVMESNPSETIGDNLPVEQVSWGDCQRFIAELNNKVSGGEFRLPSEAEWEYACRAGSTTPYCYGEGEKDLGEYAWYDANSGMTTHPVGRKKPNVWGLYDMHGNVMEWCRDWQYDSYRGAPSDGTAWEIPAGSSRVFRGGVWYNDPVCCRSAFRGGSYPESRTDGVGFRLCRTVVLSTPEPVADVKDVPLSDSIPSFTPTETPRNTPTATDTPSFTPTVTPSETPILTATFTATDRLWNTPTVTDTPIRKIGDATIISIPGTDVSIEMVYIPGGSFGGERPVHTVWVAPFWMGKYEVTQAQWKAVMGSNPSSYKGDDLPVECVSWYDCVEFISKLNDKVPGAGFRLPSESEWEYACRAGSTTAYCYGDDEEGLGEYAWYEDNSGDKTHPVGQKKPNDWGLYDMHGNVREWCLDWYHDSYTGAPSNGTAWESSAASYRVLRGGSWDGDPRGCRSADRSRFYPDLSFFNIGFRFIRTP